MPRGAPLFLGEHRKLQARHRRDRVTERGCSLSGGSARRLWWGSVDMDVDGW